MNSHPAIKNALKIIIALGIWLTFIMASHFMIFMLYKKVIMDERDLVILILFKVITGFSCFLVSVLIFFILGMVVSIISKFNHVSAPRSSALIGVLLSFSYLFIFDVFFRKNEVVMAHQFGAKYYIAFTAATSAATIVGCCMALMLNRMSNAEGIAATAAGD